MYKDFEKSIDILFPKLSGGMVQATDGCLGYIHKRFQVSQNIPGEGNGLQGVIHGGFPGEARQSKMKYRKRSSQ